jgi:hypothetical protein
MGVVAALVVTGLSFTAVRTMWHQDETSMGDTSPGDKSTDDASRGEKSGDEKSTATVTPPPEHVPWDYQIGGAYTPPTGVQVVSRSHEGAPAPGVYTICNINAFQVQEGEEGDWESDLLLRDDDGKVVYDKDWGEAVLDIRTAAKRKRIADKVNSWIDECAAKGYKAVEPDNYDVFTRFPKYLEADQAKAQMKLLSTHAHDKGLAVAQKNTLELVADRKSVGLDFAVVEECAEWNECGAFAEAFGDNVLVVEYSAKGLSAACSGWGDSLSVVRRDELVVPKGASGYVRRTC